MKAHEIVLEWVTDELRSGRLHVGDHLPSERALSQTLEVSRSAIREAFRVLEVLGTIRTSTGSGPSSGTIITATPEQGLSRSLNLQIATRQVEAYDMVQLRILLETWCAKNADPALGDWDAAEQVLDRMDDPSLDIPTFLRLDTEFHVICSGAASNPLVSIMMDALRLSISDQTQARAQAVEDWEDLAPKLRGEHRAIFAALKSGENEHAATLLEQHITGYYERTA
ncbi:FadR/GntR family transcriptional regulator [Gulosibacter chungangensis]|uniref:FadR family transcriptional regulator n=1 Tax=Gulosibacter chungangensis TaxID=979746 RepID=A0A7J5B7A2_9MICO|nr:FCD domain-containing protein [Gulosibacter chungangensis]KAB1640700.1 FadR family transcriptional regulator [Gulosibacter chungangensis]